MDFIFPMANYNLNEVGVPEKIKYAKKGLWSKKLANPRSKSTKLEGQFSPLTILYTPSNPINLFLIFLPTLHLFRPPLTFESKYHSYE